MRNVLPRRGSPIRFLRAVAQPAWLSSPDAARWLIAMVLVACTWNVGGNLGNGGIEPSWNVANHLAAASGFQYGKQLLFTYGPLGFLVSPLSIHGWLQFFSVCYLFSTHCVFAYLLLARIAVDLSLLGRSALVLVVLMCLDVRYFQPELAVVDGLLIASTLMAEPRSDRARLGAALVFVGVGAFHLLVKFGTGMPFFLFAGALLLVRSAGRWRAFALAGAVGGGTLMVLWVLLGQGLGNLVPWFRGSLQLVSGYAEAMCYPPPTDITGLKAFEPTFGLLIVAYLLWQWWATRCRQTESRWNGTVWFLTLVACSWYFAKQGFIRHDEHSHVFFLFLLTTALTFPPFAGRRTAFGLASFTVFVFFLASPNRPIAFRLDQLVEGTKAFHQQVRLVLSGDARAADAVGQGVSLASALHLPKAIVARVGRAPVHVDPWRTSAVLAHNLNWKPVPVFARYAAFTPQLDALNAAALAGSDSPQVILLEQGAAIDNRHPLFESPEYSLRRLCNYRVVLEDAGWQVLARTQPRCGPETELQRQEVSDGDSIPIPRPTRPDAAVVARIQAREPWSAAIERMGFRPTSGFTLELDGHRYSLAMRLARGPLLMHLPASPTPPEMSVSYAKLVLRGIAGSASVVFSQIPLAP